MKIPGWSRLPLTTGGAGRMHAPEPEQVHAQEQARRLFQETFPQGAQRTVPPDVLGVPVNLHQQRDTALHDLLDRATSRAAVVDPGDVLATSYAQVYELMLTWSAKPSREEVEQLRAAALAIAVAAHRLLQLPG